MNDTIVISKKIKSRIAKRLVIRAQKNTQFLHINLWKERYRQQDKDTPHFQYQRYANCKNDSLHSFRSVHDAKTGDGTNTCNIIHMWIFMQPSTEFKRAHLDGYSGRPIMYCICTCMSVPYSFFHSIFHKILMS